MKTIAALVNHTCKSFIKTLTPSYISPHFPVIFTGVKFLNFLALDKKESLKFTPEIYLDNLIAQVLLTALGCPHVTGKNASLKQILIFIGESNRSRFLI